MTKRINIGSEFLSMTCPKDKQWLKHIYWGFRNGTGSHLHLTLSGAGLLADTWYFRDINNVEVIKNGSELTHNTNDLLEIGVPPILANFRNPEHTLSWDIEGLGSIFGKTKKPRQNA